MPTEQSKKIIAQIRRKSFLQLINGTLTAGATTIPVIDPATEEVLLHAPVADKAQANQAIESANQAFSLWRTLPISDRVSLLLQLLDRIEAHRDLIAQIITLEVGKPLAAAYADVDLALMWGREVTQMSLEPTRLEKAPDTIVEIHHAPLGVVLAIIPWNFPFFQTLYKLVPALMCGNTLIIKPAPTTPLNALLLAELAHDLFLAGVLNILGDAGDLGPHLSQHPDIHKISFTGSTSVGRHVMASGASNLKRIVLELGGNDAALVLDDANLEMAAKSIFDWAFMNSGQVCINIKRIYVPTKHYDAFCTLFAAHAQRAVLGHGLNEQTEFGPLQNKRQFETIKQLLEQAKKDGTIVAGGTITAGKGYFVPLTVVRDIDENSPLITEETFGPIRAIMPYHSIDDAIQRINNTPYGLGNSVWSSDLERARTIAQQLESGTVWINTHFALAPDVPFGGHKQSGLGVEFGIEGLLAFTAPKVIHINIP